MTNHPNRSQSVRKRAQALGYSIYQGEYLDTPDNRLGRWYVEHRDDEFRRPYGPGHATQREAWEAALEDHDLRCSA